MWQPHSRRRMSTSALCCLGLIRSLLREESPRSPVQIFLFMVPGPTEGEGVTCTKVCRPNPCQLGDSAILSNRASSLPKRTGKLELDWDDDMPETRTCAPLPLRGSACQPCCLASCQMDRFRPHWMMSFGQPGAIAPGRLTV